MANDNLDRNKILIPNGLGKLKTLEFVRDKISEFSGSNKPQGGVGKFSSKIGYAISLCFKEKEIFVFVLLQWASIGIAYLLWVLMLDWIPEEVWRTAAESDEGSIVDVILLAWSFVCVGIAAFPVGILTGCMGATHFLHKQKRESTIAMCLKLVMPRAWPLWIFHWIDGWVTVKQIFERLPPDERKNKILSETLYYAWKLGIAGIFPSIVTGASFRKSARNSIFFVKDNFLEIAKLRAGYSALCWIVGIAAYIGSAWFLFAFDILPEGGEDELYRHMYTIYLWLGVPILVALSIVMLILRPIYVLAICDLFSEYLSSRNEKVSLPANPQTFSSALVAFGTLCLLVIVVIIFRDELGVTAMLSTPVNS